MFRLYAGLFLVFSTTSAQAQDAPRWEMEAGKSTLAFSVPYDKDTIEGTFPGFSAEIYFSPDAPERGRIEVSVPVADFSSEDYDAREYLPEEAWLDTEHYKTAKFLSKEIVKTGNNAYLAKGALALKDIKQPLEVPFTLNVSEDGRHAVAKGAATLSRLTYAIGKGEEEDAALLADAVTVRFHVEARKAE